VFAALQLLLLLWLLSSCCCWSSCCYCYSCCWSRNFNYCIRLCCCCCCSCSCCCNCACWDSATSKSGAELPLFNPSNLPSLLPLGHLHICPVHSPMLVFRAHPWCWFQGRHEKSKRWAPTGILKIICPSHKQQHMPCIATACGRQLGQWKGLQWRQQPSPGRKDSYRAPSRCGGGKVVVEGNCLDSGGLLLFSIPPLNFTEGEKRGSWGEVKIGGLELQMSWPEEGWQCTEGWLMVYWRGLTVYCAPKYISLSTSFPSLLSLFVSHYPFNCFPPHLPFLIFFTISLHIFLHLLTFSTTILFPLAILSLPSLFPNFSKKFLLLTWSRWNWQWGEDFSPNFGSRDECKNPAYRWLLFSHEFSTF
jgi:hypothetical protein